MPSKLDYIVRSLSRGTNKKCGEGIIVEVKDRYVSVEFNGVMKFWLIETIETFF